MTDNIYHYIVRLPDGFDEMIAPCCDGYTIWIDDRLSPKGREDAYRHAIKHIERGDWEKSNVQNIESDIRR